MMFQNSVHKGIGPLIVVSRRQDAPTTETYESASPLELTSLENEVKRLLAYIDVVARHHENALEEKDAHHAAKLEQAQCESASALTHRRHEYERACSNLQTENNQLRSRLDSLEDSETKLSALNKEAVDASRKLSEQETAWSNLMRSKEAHFQACMRELEEERNTLNERVDVLVRSVETLESTLRETMYEKERLDEFIHTEPARWMEASRAAQQQIDEQKSTIHELRRRNNTLEVLLDDLQRDGAVHASAVDERVSLLKHEVESEKKKNAELVSLYCGQMENLHAQLEASMMKNKMLLLELQREKAGGAIA